MKKVIFLFTLNFLFLVSGFSQTVNGIPIKEINAEYIQIESSPGEIFNNNIRILIDFGQEKRGLSTKEEIIKDADGKKMTFNSMIDALNFMSANGYEFVQAYGVSISNKEIHHYYLMRKKKVQVNN